MKLSLQWRELEVYLRQKERVKMNNFIPNVLVEVGRIITSEDLEHRLSIVKDDRHIRRVLIQVWWREDINADFNPGNGYTLNPRKAITISRLMKQAISEVDTIFESPSTNTQKHIVYNKSNIVSVDKYWRKSETEEWALGKSVAINLEKADELANLLKTAGLMIIHTK
jgi:hypothetical protein